MLESSLVSTRNSMSGFVEFIVACSWKTLTVLLTLLQLISIVFSLDLVLALARSGVDVCCWVWCKYSVLVMCAVCVVVTVWERFQSGKCV